MIAHILSREGTEFIVSFYTKQMHMWVLVMISEPSGRIYQAINASMKSLVQNNVKSIQKYSHQQHESSSSSSSKNVWYKSLLSWISRGRYEIFLLAVNIILRIARATVLATVQQNSKYQQMLVALWESFECPPTLRRLRPLFSTSLYIT